MWVGDIFIIYITNLFHFISAYKHTLKGPKDR